MGPQGNMEKQNTQRKDLSMGEGMHICVLYIHIYIYTYIHTDVCTVLYIFTSIYTKTP